MEAADFTTDEYKALDDFFEKRIAIQTDLDTAWRQFAELLSDRSINVILRNRIIESFLYASDSVSIHVDDHIRIYTMTRKSSLKYVNWSLSRMRN